ACSIAARTSRRPAGRDTPGVARTCRRRAAPQRGPGRTALVEAFDAKTISPFRGPDAGAALSGARGGPGYGTVALGASGAGGCACAGFVRDDAVADSAWAGAASARLAGAPGAARRRAGGLGANARHSFSRNLGDPRPVEPAAGAIGKKALAKQRASAS